MNGYELVNKWVKEEKRTSFPDNIFNSKDEKIALEILKQYYGAKYEPSDDFHYCGTWYINNPYRPKAKGYELRYSFRGSSEWKSCCCISTIYHPLWENRVAEEICRLENCEENKEEIAQFLAQNFYYVGKERFWEIIEKELYV